MHSEPAGMALLQIAMQLCRKGLYCLDFSQIAGICEDLVRQMVYGITPFFNCPLHRLIHERHGILKVAVGARTAKMLTVGTLPTAVPKLPAQAVEPLIHCVGAIV